MGDSLRGARAPGQYFCHILLDYCFSSAIFLPGRNLMLNFDGKTFWLQGSGGSLAVPGDDEITLKLAMLYEGECEGQGAAVAAGKFGYSKQRYYQLLQAYSEKGALALLNRQRGPKSNYRRNNEVVRQIIRHRFLDPDASAQVIAQKLQQGGWPISIRSVHRVFEEYGLQKKTLGLSSRR
jgi:transposase